MAENSTNISTNDSCAAKWKHTNNGYHKTVPE